MEEWRLAGAVSLAAFGKDQPLYFGSSIPGPVQGSSSPLGRRDSSPREVSSFPRPNAKGHLSGRGRGGSRPRSRLRSWGAPEGGVLVLPALPELAWAAGAGRPRLPTPVTAAAAAAPLLWSRPVRSRRRVALPAPPPLGLRPVRAPGEPGGGRTVSRLGRGSGSALLRCRPRLLPGLRAALGAPPPPPPARPAAAAASPRGLRRSGRSRAAGRAAGDELRRRSRATGPALPGDTPRASRGPGDARRARYPPAATPPLGPVQLAIHTR